MVLGLINFLPVLVRLEFITTRRIALQRSRCQMDYLGLILRIKCVQKLSKSLKIRECNFTYSEKNNAFSRKRSYGFLHLFHAPSEQSADFLVLREIGKRIDELVMLLYGWTDIQLAHGFHEVAYQPHSDRLRFTISESARVEILKRLGELNRQRSEDEFAKELNGNALSPTSTLATRASRNTRASNIQSSLDFEVKAVGIIDNLVPATVIINFLRERDNWQAKADVLAATGITDGQWNASITDLISSGKVERQGERRGARYRLQPGTGHRYDHHEGTP
ncbi:MAG: hypothetical protein IPK97_17200 [Ahniella sp.]|nr:hypothetical protein [Ahniella sp.]